MEEYVWVFHKPGSRTTVQIPASEPREKKTNWFVAVIALLEIISHTLT